MDADVIIVGAGPVGLMLAGERGQDPAAEALRELVGELLADEQPLRRLGALIAGTSIRYPMPGPSQHALDGTFVSRPDPAHRPGHHQRPGVPEQG